MTESELQAAIMRAARQLGYIVYHTKYSIGSAPGYPDAAICGKGRYWLFEFKGPKGRVSEAQQAWIDELQAAGIDARIVWPDDYDGVIRELQAAYEAAFRQGAA
jgi:hypothetical protein